VGCSGTDGWMDEYIYGCIGIVGCITYVDINNSAQEKKKTYYVVIDIIIGC